MTSIPYKLRSSAASARRVADDNAEPVAGVRLEFACIAPASSICTVFTGLPRANPLKRLAASACDDRFEPQWSRKRFVDSVAHFAGPPPDSRKAVNSIDGPFGTPHANVCASGF